MVKFGRLPGRAGAVGAVVSRRLPGNIPPPAAATGSGIEPYRPPAWLTNPHAQTIYASCLARAPRVAFSRERWDTPDGDFVDLDWLPARGLVLSVNGKPRGEPFAGEAFYAAILKIFIGADPVDENLKAGLLGQA